MWLTYEARLKMLEEDADKWVEALMAMKIEPTAKTCVVLKSRSTTPLSKFQLNWPKDVKFNFLDVEPARACALDDLIDTKLYALDPRRDDLRPPLWVKPEVVKPHVAGLDVESIDWEAHKSFMRSL